MIRRKSLDEGLEGRDARAARNQDGIPCSIHHELAIGELDPHESPRGQLLLHPGRIDPLDGVDDPENPALSWRRRDGENPRFRPAGRRIIFVQRQMQELAGMKGGHGTLRLQLDRIDTVAVTRDRFD